jgi:acetyl esterase
VTLAPDQPEIPPGLAPGSRATFAEMARLGLLEGAKAATVEEIRRSAAEEGPLWGEPPQVARVEDHRIDTSTGQLPLRVYWPGGRAERAILWIHGGGWVVGDLSHCEVDCRRLCVETSSLVVAVEYRLAPEHPFPAGLEDCRAALDWLAGELGTTYSPRELVVGGDSAGGNLTAALCLLARQRGGPAIGQQLLVYPVADDDFETGSYREFGEDYVLTEDSMRLFWRSYVGEGEAPELAAVLRAPDLRGLPPATFVIAGCDVLRDEAESYAARLAEAAVPVDVLRYPGELHGFWSYGAVSEMPRLVNADVRECLRRRAAQPRVS